MPKLETRDMNPLFRLNASDAEKIAAETIRRAQRPRPAAAPAPASEKAAAWAKTLWSQKQTDQLPSALREIGARLADGQEISARNCSRLIDAMKGLPYAPKAPVAPVASITDGFYKLGDDFVKVQEAKHGSGHLYAKRWDGDSWQYESGLVRKLRPEMELTAEQAKEFGKLYGCCIYCSLDLTDERSITAGYGPKCASKRGLPWG